MHIDVVAFGSVFDANWHENVSTMILPEWDLLQ